MRSYQRNDDQLRPFSVERGFQPHAAASLLIRMGDTHVCCAVTVEEKVPPFLKNSGSGWITAEYGMLPCATNSRTQREAVRGRQGRTYEIQRLIGRSLRMLVDLDALGERTLRVDCDVLRADGGTRCASITGAALAVADAVAGLYEKGLVAELPRITPVAAVSAGVVDGRALLDLDYREDASAHADANFVLTADGRVVEAQCTAESAPIAAELFLRLQELAGQGVAELIASLWGEQS